jgi:type IV pilus assembly protein PilA
MMHSLKERFDREDEGFTLIELMVVVLIIAILLAIAIPTFLGARDSANARSAQSNLRNALTAEQTYWTNNQSWDVTPATTTAGSVAATETSLQWSSSGAVKPGNQVLVTDDTAANNGIVLESAAKDGHCYAIEAIDQPGGTVSLAAGTYYYESTTTPANGTTGCAATDTPAMTVAATPGSAAKTPGTWSTTF